MHMLDENDKLLRSDVHPLAVVESEYAMTECAVCELPVGEERPGDVFCSSACEEKAFDDALWDDAISAHRTAKEDVLVDRLFDLTDVLCSCPNHT